MSNIEILSPAGDEKSFFACIYNGANAIYLGLQNFNARNKAQNFTLKNLKYYVNIAHLYNVKIYVVINTLITNQEMPELLSLVKGAIDSKVDAFIVQDIGVARVLKNTFDGINLHASTQMGIHSLQGAKILESLGFSRVVLSREVSKEDIIQIKQNTKLELEYFVHGALCVSFSGNCYLSSLSSNESGNRGRCLQPCRLNYFSNADEKNIKKGYLLSANDLCLIDKINLLKEYGISSFKIEGRLRRPSYVAYVTRMYSSACNLVEKEDFKTVKLRLLNFKKLFNRGEYNTGYYLEGEPNKDTINTAFQNHRGIEIGRVKYVKPFKDIYEICVLTNGYEIKKNDGLKFVFNFKETSLGVGSVKQKSDKEYIIYTKVNPEVSSVVYLTVDNNWEESLVSNTRKIKFLANFFAHKNSVAKLKLTAGNISIERSTNCALEQAKTKGLQESDVKENLQKTKDTFFELEKLTCDIDNVFMPKSTLNELRRNALECLQREIIKDYEIKNLKSVTIKKYLLNTSDVNQNLDTNFLCINEYTKFEDIKKHFTKKTNIVFSPTNWNLENVKLYFEKIKETFKVKKIYFNLPKVLRCEDYKIVENIISSFNKNEVGIVANNLGEIYFATLGYDVVGGVYLNITNSESVGLLKDFGVKFFTRSFEQFSTLKSGLVFVGLPEVMTFCHCPYKTNYDYFDCKDCKFDKSLMIKAENGKSYHIRRTKLKNCIFELVDTVKLNMNFINENGIFLDLRT